MKTFLVAVIISILGNSIVYAQYFRETGEGGSGYESKLNIGIKAGFNISWLRLTDGSEIEMSEPKFGLAGGLFLETNSSKTVNFATEIMFNSIGGGFSGFNSNVNIGLHYITLPALLKFDLGYMGKIYLGPQVGFFLGGRVAAGGNSIGFSEGYTNTDFGLVLGGSNPISEKLLLDARFYYGASNIDTEMPIPNFRENNLYLQISIGYILN